MVSGCEDAGTLKSKDRKVDTDGLHSGNMRSHGLALRL